MATNVAAPFGFRPVRYLNGTPWNGKFRIYYIGSTSASTTPIGLGDPVSMLPSGSTWTATTYTDPLGYCPSVVIAPVSASAQFNFVGIAVAFGQDPSNMFTPTDLYTNWRAASTARYVGVVDDPNVVFQVQDDGSTASGLSVKYLDARWLGTNIDHVLPTNTASTFSGLSTAVIANSTAAATSSLLFKILGLSMGVATPSVPNEFLQAYCTWDVVINNNIFKAGTQGHAVS